MNRRSGRIAAAGALLAVLLAGCTAQPEPTDAAPPASPTPTSAVAAVERLTAVGDSITLGVNACGEVARCPEAAWATGTDASVESLAARLAAETGVAPETSVVAGEGAQMGDLVDDVPAIVAGAPDLVAILLGANDACATSLDAVTSAADYREAAESVVGGIADALPEATVLVLSVPGVGRLWEQGRQVDAVVATWERWSACASMFADPTSDAADDVDRRAQVEARIDEYDSALAEVCAARANCRFDGGSVHDMPIEAADVSTLDFFHPSAAGQRQIAQAAWDALTAEPGSR
ncbi:GDSL-type esterase/lipase family protein [Agromyces sp. LHK192]|uniref:SGNH/GDSL hydrolase family protein n=1 Tax=Agromyces sp. LHK192 TaxID=2498704 RepID=UPI0013E34480|nr:GDSL-type esterase/lipase family protein [Agromyces sp. LHK192]